MGRMSVLAFPQDGVFVTRPVSHTCIDISCLPCDTATLLLQPVNERLRLLGGTAKVALDLLEYDSQLERAFITICGCVLPKKGFRVVVVPPEYIQPSNQSWNGTGHL